MQKSFSDYDTKNSVSKLCCYLEFFKNTGFWWRQSPTFDDVNIQSFLRVCRFYAFYWKIGPVTKRVAQGRGRSTPGVTIWGWHHFMV